MPRYTKEQLQPLIEETERRIRENIAIVTGGDLGQLDLLVRYVLEFRRRRVDMVEAKDIFRRDHPTQRQLRDHAHPQSRDQMLIKLRDQISRHVNVCTLCRAQRQPLLPAERMRIRYRGIPAKKKARGHHEIR